MRKLLSILLACTLLGCTSNPSTTSKETSAKPEEEKEEVLAVAVAFLFDFKTGGSTKCFILTQKK